jgi:hypothetical protein
LQIENHDVPVRLHSGNLLWLGEHWINAIRRPNEQQPSAWVSLFHTRWSTHGEGNAAQIFIPGENGLSVVCGDRTGLMKWINERFFVHSSVRDPNAKLVPATFRREGDSHKDPAWVIETMGRTIIARWRVTEPPVIASGSFKEGTEHFTALFFTDDSSVELDGRRIEGSTYPRDIWMKSIGGMRSSSVFALAETLMEI